MKFYLNEDPITYNLKSLRKKNSNEANRHCEINKSQRPLHVQFSSILFKIIINVNCLHIYCSYKDGLEKLRACYKPKLKTQLNMSKKQKNTILFNDR